MDKQTYWNESFKQAQSRGYKAEESKRIASLSASNYREPATGKRSMAMSTSYTDQGNVMDILVGYPDSGLEANAVDSLDNSGWESFQGLNVKADLEHYNLDYSNGVANQLDEKWQHFGIETEMYKQGSEVRAKITIPETELGEEFKRDYKSGKYGASIEYGGYQDGNKVTDWQITGVSFTQNPHYKTKPTTGTENIQE